MREKLRTADGKAISAKRKQTVEPVFGIIKQTLGFRQFLLLGLDKVSTEWALVCLAYNFKRLARHSLPKNDRQVVDAIAASSPTGC